MGNITFTLKLESIYYWSFTFTFFFFSIPFLLWIHHRSFIYTDVSNIPETRSALVLGAGLNDEGEPGSILRTRLDRGAELYEAGVVDEIIVSGLAEPYYSEPDSMSTYLIETHDIPPEAIYLDGRGYDTYASCEGYSNNRSDDDSALILVSSGYHLPRAIMLCRHFDVESYGISSSEATFIGERFYEIREYIAFYKAIIEMWVR